MVDDTLLQDKLDSLSIHSVIFDDPTGDITRRATLRTEGTAGSSTGGSRVQLTGGHRLNLAEGLHHCRHSVYGSTVCEGMRQDSAAGGHVPPVPPGSAYAVGD